MQVNALPTGDESIQAWIVDNVETDIRRSQSGDFENGVCPFAKGLFDFSVSNQALAEGWDRSP